MDEPQYDSDFDLWVKNEEKEVQQAEQEIAQATQQQADNEARVQQLETQKKIDELEKTQPLKNKNRDDAINPLPEFNGEKFTQVNGETVKTDEYRAYQYEQAMAEVGDAWLDTPGLKQIVTGVGDFAADAIGPIGEALDNVNPIVQGARLGGNKDAKALGHITEPLSQFWKDNVPKERTHGNKLIRDASAIIIPNVVGTGWGLKAASSLTTAGTKMRTAANLAAIFGPDLAVTGLSSQSQNEHNFSNALNSMLGLKISPWATTAEDSPDTILKKHLADSVMMSGFGELLGLAMSKIGKSVQYIPESETAKVAMRDPQLAELDETLAGIPAMRDQQLKEVGKVRSESGGLINRESMINKVLSESEDMNKPAMQGMRDKWVAESANYELDRVKLTGQWDEAEAATKAMREQRLRELADPAGEIDIARSAREASMTDEGIRRIDADPMGNNGADPYINKMDTESAPLQNTQGKPIQAKTDLYRIQNNIGTIDGMMNSPTTEYWLKQYMNLGDAASRSAYLKRLFDDIAQPVSAIYKKGDKFVPMPAASIDNAVKNLVSTTLLDDINYEDYISGLQSLRVFGEEGSKTLDGNTFKMVKNAFDEVYDLMFSPQQLQASAMLTKQLADNIQTASEAIEVVGRQFDTTAHQQLIFQKLQAMAKEVEAAKYIQGQMQEAMKIASKGDIVETAEHLWGAKEMFQEGIRGSRRLGDDFVKEMNAIVKENPEWAKPMIAVYNATGGDVDTLYKMKVWTEKSLGLFKKSLIDFNDPKVPSQLVEQLWGVKYNSALSGKSPLRAVTGNGLMMAAKPISAFTGSLVRGDMADFARSTYVYGGIAENFQRGWKEMVSKWKQAIDDPLKASQAGRTDMAFQSALDKQEALSAMREGLRADAAAGVTGASGQLGYLNATEVLRGFNNHKLVRYGINALYAVDGLTRGVMQSGVKRANAYDQLLKTTPGGIVDPKAFDDLQKKLYNEAFGPDGMITDSHAAWATNEIALNLPNSTAVAFEGFMKQVPAARALFMFARTGLESINLATTFAPGSTLIPGLNNAARAFRATSKDEVLDALMRHGYDSEFLKTADTDVLISALKSEYVGRQMMGAGLVMAGGIYALNGNITGEGPKEYSARQALEQQGWQPKSIKNPLTGEWHSYQGFEPFDKILSLTAQIVNESQRVEQATAEQWLTQLSWAVVANVGNDTFLSGIQPLAQMYSGDAAAWKRFVAMQADQIIPGSGVRSVLNNAISPGLKDVEKTLQGYFANKWKFLPAIGGKLANEVDFYTGLPIRVNDNPINAAANALLPVFKSNGEIEPWRQWLQKTEWGGLSETRVNKKTGQKATPETRRFIAEHIGKSGKLRNEIIEMSKEPKWMQQVEEQAAANAAKGVGRGEQKGFRKELPVYKRLDRIHDIAISEAWDAWEDKHNNSMGVKGLQRAADRAILEGRPEEAAQLSADQKALMKVVEYSKK